MINFLFTKTPLVFFVQSFWRDEAFTYFLAKQNVAEIISLTIKDFNPPFYYLIMHVWMQIFQTSEISLRLFSLICYWGIVYLAFLFLKNIFKLSLSKCFLYLVFFLFNPLFIYYAFEARMYTLLAFLAGLSFYFFYQKKKVFYIITTIIGLYNHYFMIFVVLGQLLFVYIVKDKKWLKQIKPIIISILSFIPWLVFLFINKPVFSQSFWIKKPTLINILHFFGILYTGHESNVYSSGVDTIKKIIFFINLILFFVVFLGIIKIVNSKNKNDRQLFLLLCIWGIFTPLFIGFISFFKPIYIPRYLIFATFGFLILFVFILNKLTKKLTQILFVLMLLLSIFYNYYQIQYRKKTNFAKTVKEIKNLANERDYLYVVNELDYFTAKYYFDEKKVYIYHKTYQEIPDYTGKVLIPIERITYKLPTYPKKAFILNHDGSYEIQAMY